MPVEIDLLSAVTSENVAGLLGGIAAQTRAKAQLARGLKLPRLERERLAGDPYPAFFEWLARVEETLGDKLIMLNLDEYEQLEEMIGDGRLDRRIFHWLRSLIQSHPQVVVLLSGSHTVEELSPPWSDALINVRPLRVDPLAEDEARELITEPLPDFPLQYEPEAVEAILEATGCQPFLIQATCRDLVHHLNQVGRRHATRAGVDRILDSVLQSGATYFNELWTSPDTDAAQRAVLRVLARAGREVVGREELLRRAEAPGYEVFRRLEWRDVIEPVDVGFTFSNPPLISPNRSRLFWTKPF